MVNRARLAQLVLLIALFCLPGPAFGATAVDALVDKGQEAYQSQDYPQAFHWFSLAADKGSAAAMYQLGDMYKHGYGVRLNYLDAAQWFRKAAKRGNSQAQFKLAMMYKKGLGVDRSLEQSVHWLQIAAKANHGAAQVSLGLARMTGKGVKKDYEKAAQWFQSAVKQNLVSAMNNLGYLYEHGLGVKQDLNKALKLYGQANSEWSLNRKAILVNKMACVKDAVTKLFKTELKCTDRESMSEAIKQGGARAIEEDFASWGDAYLTESNLFGNAELYVAYTLDNHFAIAQYTYAEVMDRPRLLKLKEILVSTYGPPDLQTDLAQAPDKGGQLTFIWQLEDGIKLSLSRSWPELITELTYSFPENFETMLMQQDKQDSVNGTNVRKKAKKQFF